MIESLKNIPKRSLKPRNHGITMMMDKGLSIKEVENFIECNLEFTDLIKLGFGTSIITPNIIDKIKIYRKNGLKVFPGGTLFEAFYIRGQLNDYKNYLHKIGVDMLEISDGSINIDNNEKCNIIHEFSKEFKVVSEVGCKDANIEIKSQNWVDFMRNELESGSWKVITEAREGGNVGIFNTHGEIKSGLVNDINNQININDIIWESPNKNQQAWFIKKFGANVNLGNISHNDIIPLECLRLGLRGDTFNIQ